MTQTAPGVVLVIEDDPDIREAIADVLSLSGYANDTVANGREGLSWLETHPAPALVLLDLHMPVMNGIEFLEALRTQSQWRRLPVTLFSADGRLDGRAAELGVSSYLAKPIDLDALLERVGQHFHPHSA